MTAPTHIAIGFSAAIGFIRLTGITPSPIGILVIIIGSIAPDIDHENGSIARPGTLLRNFVSWRTAKSLDSVGLAVSRMFQRMFGHRGALHWPMTGIAILVISVVFDLELLFWFGWAYLWHIIGDFCTAGGVPVFGPFSRHNVKWSKLRTGSYWEALICVVLVASIIYFGFDLLPETNQYWIKQYLDFFT